MAELIGVVSAVIGFAATAVEISRGIIGVIDGMKNGPKNLQQLQQELTDLEAILTEIATPKSSIDEKGGGDNITEMAVRSCLVELQKLQDVVQPLQSEGKDGLRKRFRMHMQGEGEIKEIIEKLQSRKLTLCLALMTSLSGKISNTGVGGHGLQRTSTAKPHEHGGLQRTNSIKEPSTWMEIAVHNINQRVTTALSQFMQNPNAKIEDLLDIDKSQAQDFWKMDLGSINQLRDLVWKQRQEKLLESLYAPDYQKDRLDIKAASASTCEWILDQPQYLSWKHSTESCALHVYGKPGSGKSVLAKSILERFSASISEDDTRKEKWSLLYYFCSNRNRSDEAASSILRALIHQLIRQQTNLIGVILQSNDLIDSHPFLGANGKPTWSLESLWKMFTLLVTNSQSQVVYCIIDGLDESEKTSVKTLLSLLPELLGRRTEGPVFKLFLTSRLEEHIEEGLEDYASRIRIDSDVIQHDISRFVSERLGKIKKRLRLNAQEESELRGNLVTRAEGMFLWAKLAMEEAEKTRGLTTKKLKSLIRTLPSGLNGLYKRILEKIDAECADAEDLRLVQKILTWIVLATRPLTLAELRICLALEPGMDSLDPDDLMRNLRQDVQVLCGSFIEIIPGKKSEEDQPSYSSPDTDFEESEDLSATVRLVHQSAKDYLIDIPCSLQGPLSKFRISTQHGHNEIALLCLTYLLSEEFESGPLVTNTAISHECTFDESSLGNEIVTIFQNKLENNPFLDYAATHWPFHTRQACKAGEAHDVIALAGDLLNDYPMHFASWDQISAWLRLISTVPDISETRYGILESALNKYPANNSGLNSAVFHGLTDVVQHLLDVKNVDDNLPDRNGYTPLVTALGNNHQAEVDDVSKIIKLLLEKGVDIETTKTHGYSPLHLAIQNNHPVAAKLLLESGANPNAEAEDGWGILQHAAESGSLELVRLLLDKGADIEGKNREAGWFPLALAAKCDHVGVVRLLLARGASHKTCTHFHRYPLHVQAEYGNSQEIVNLLLDSGADIDKIDDGGCTPLLDAVKEGKLDTAKLLLRRGANPRNSNVFQAAARRGFLDLAQLFFDKGVDIDASDYSRTALQIVAEAGNLDFVRFLLDKGADIEKRSSEAGWFALALAAKENHLEITKLLLDRGADVNSFTYFGRTALHVQIEYGNSQEIVNLLLDKGADIDAADHVSCTPLLDAFEAERLDIAELLLRRGANDGKIECLHLAARRGLLDMAKLLLDKGVDVDAKDDLGWSALQMAAEDGQLDLVRLLLDRGADIEGKTDEAGWFALALAAKTDHLEVVKLLIDRGAGVNSYTDFGRTSLHVQAEYGNSQDIVRILLDNGADIDKLDEAECSPLLDAVIANKPETAKILLDQGANINKPNIFTSAIELGLLEVVQTLLDRGVDLKKIDYSDALNTATQEGFLELIQLLLNHGVDIKKITNDSLHKAVDGGFLELATTLIHKGAGFDHGDYPIFLDAASSNCQPIIMLLLALGRDIEQTNKDGWNALHFSASRGDDETVKTLLDNGIQINTAENSGRTALFLAIRENKLDTATLLLDRGADITPVDEDGWDAFGLAAHRGHLSLVSRFLKIKPDLDLERKISDAGWFVLALAATNDHLKVVEFLLDRGANINNYTNFSRTALHVAAEYGKNLQMIRLLLGRGANINHIDCRGYTALMDAVEMDRLDVVTLLLDRGADINVAESGISALHIAAERGFYHVTELLLSRGADSELKTYEGFTALCLANKAGHKPLAFLFERKY